MIDDQGVISILWPCEREAFRVPDRVPVSQWCNDNVVLLPEYSVNYSGPYRWQMMPFSRDILDISARPGVLHLVLKFSTQVAKTTIIYNLIAHHIDQDPASAMLMYPSDDACKEISRTRLQPHFEACEPVRRKIPSDRKLYQLQEMHFPGMVLYLVSASGVTGMAQKPIKRLYRDEVNKYPRSIGEHGNPMDLSLERLKASWGSRQVIDVSSPTEMDGAITLEEGKCQVVLRYYVPCPHCLRLQTLEWTRQQDEGEDDEKKGMVVFEDHKDLPRAERIEIAKKTAHYVCRYCGEAILDHHKGWMLSPESGAGWYDMNIDEPAASDDPIQDLFDRFSARGSKLESVAFRLSSLYSTFITFGDVVEKFLDAHLAEENRFDKLRSFTNDWLGQEWRDVVAEREASVILGLRGDLPSLIVPDWSVALTLGTDNQKRGKYFTVWAWGRDFTRHLVHYGILFDWDELTELVYRNSYRVDGTERMINIWRGSLDTGGGDLDEQDSTMTQESYEWLSRYGGNVVYGYKGSSRPMADKMRATIIGTYPGSKRPIPGAGVRLWTVDSGYFKDLLHNSLSLPSGTPGCVYLHAETGADFASHLTSEVKRRNKRGLLQWERVSGQNHYLDCSVMSSFLVDPMCLGGIRVLFPAVAQPAAASPKEQDKGLARPHSPAGGKRRLW